MTYRAELSDRVLGQLGDFPAKAFDALINVLSAVIEYPDDPLRTFATSDPYVRRAEFGGAGSPMSSTMLARKSRLPT